MSQPENSNSELVDREMRIKAAADRIWQNLINSGIINKIIQESAHATKPDSGLAYNEVRFDATMGADEMSGGVWADISIIPNKDINEGSVQPVRPKLYRFSNTPEQRTVISERIWDGIDIDSKKEIARMVIEKLKQRALGIISSESAMRGKIPEKDIQAYLNEAKKNIQELERLSEALNTGLAKTEIDNELASLKIFIPKPSK